MISKTTIIGHLGQDPDFRTLENGTAVCRLSIATSENWKDRDGNWQSKTQWHSVLCWRDLAERASKFSKGQLAFVEGRYQSSDYTDKDGIKRTRFDIHADVVRSLEKRVSEQTPLPEPSNYQPNRSHAAGPAEAGPADDLPF